MEANSTFNKRKIVNDPVHGFINIPSELIYDLIENPFFQRLRRIKQLGLTYLVYPGAVHTRFQHALGAMHLMNDAVSVLRSKGHEISEDEEEAVCIAILLHDIGHGPFSHVLEKTILYKLSHEEVSLFFMSELNKQHNGKLSLALDIFSNKYSKKFLHQLVSSQLDMDRLDYLKRDSFFTGVSEGVIGSDRIIKMLNVVDDNLVVEAKGIYSIEKFLIARRLMYWQVYLHKTVLVAECMLVNLLNRARYLLKNGENLFVTPALQYFLSNNISFNDFKTNNKALNNFALLDDDDLVCSIKGWMNSNDRVLSKMSRDLINRSLYRIEIKSDPFDFVEIDKLRKEVLIHYRLKDDSEAGYIVFSSDISNNAYSVNDEKINILFNNKQLKDISDASDVLNLSVLGKKVTKYYLCYPKTFSYLRLK
ncbi:MAG: HD domain-containing protein [Marinilabiliaceae bacterium]|nr:HD domain-containing protein [Marinilabiliaceae bacterium]